MPDNPDLIREELDQLSDDEIREIGSSLALSLPICEVSGAVRRLDRVPPVGGLAQKLVS
jgi:hypothetical protein